MLGKHGTEPGFNFHDDKCSGVRSMVQEISVKYGASLASVEIIKYISAMFPMQCQLRITIVFKFSTTETCENDEYILPRLEDKNQIVEKGRRQEGRETRK